ncbi:hypothetical protein HVL71_003136 [Escherichia coli]|uniref:hypothetical protein n=1 Tax=Enterobacteriaceae TaxID=543 RepID=UPI00179DC356|nr:MULTISPECIES: hypothetical protein [Enterobacteriaceae]EFD6874117.1 hypothetical protein [Escherichia coli]EFT2852945.1 hypothetical protein [Escherichia coli]ELY8834331.1 hypothetical protein [Escherichia coli]MBB8125357.1 hypothetical protein [Escherichia coli]MCL0931891.1 hypothetical protein [Escherichia coli]
MKKIKLVLLMPGIYIGLITSGFAEASSIYKGILPAVVNNKSGNKFWCDAYHQVRKLCKATEIDASGGFILVRSAPLKDCEAGIWGWINPGDNNSATDYIATGYTITPDATSKVTTRDMCSQDMKVTFRPNDKRPQFEDMVGLYNGKEVFRYKWPDSK